MRVMTQKLSRSELRIKKKKVSFLARSEDRMKAWLAQSLLLPLIFLFSGRLFTTYARMKNVKPGSSLQFRGWDEDIFCNGRSLPVANRLLLETCSKCCCAPPQLSAARSVATSLCSTGALVIDCVGTRGATA